MSKGWKQVESFETVSDALSNAWSEIEGLAEECREACDNFPNSGHPKAEAFGEAADTLESATEVATDDEKETGSIVIAVSDTMPRDKRRGVGGRANRLSNAVGRLEAVADFIEELKETLEERASNRHPNIHDHLCELEELVREARDLAADVEGVEFPGMFG